LKQQSRQRLRLDLQYQRQPQPRRRLFSLLLFTEQGLEQRLVAFNRLQRATVLLMCLRTQASALALAQPLAQ
jgi:hypothetical protein